MKETFRKNVENYSDLAKEELKNEKLTDELRQVIDWHVRNAAEKRGSSEDVQKEVYRLQRDKQEIMAKLREDIKRIDDPNYKPERFPEQIEVVMADNKLYALIDNQRIAVTAGEIMTDGEWGLDYYLNPASVPRNLRKKYLIEQNKKLLSFILNKQISLDAYYGKRDEFGWSYGQVLAQLEGEKKEPFGLVAEKIVRNFFKKLVYDKDLNLEILDVDVHQDVEHKIDFIIKKPKYSRAVDVETSNVVDQYEKIGVQFTVNTPLVESKKRGVARIKEQVLREEEINDLVVVSMPDDLVYRDYKRWKTNRLPGGPDKYISDGGKQAIFSAILTGMFPPEEIKIMWEQMGYNWSHNKQQVFEVPFLSLARGFPSNPVRFNVEIEKEKASMPMSAGKSKSGFKSRLEGIVEIEWPSVLKYTEEHFPEKLSIIKKQLNSGSISGPALNNLFQLYRNSLPKGDWLKEVEFKIWKRGLLDILRNNNTLLSRTSIVPETVAAEVQESSKQDKEQVINFFKEKLPGVFAVMKKNMFKRNGLNNGYTEGVYNRLARIYRKEFRVSDYPIAYEVWRKIVLENLR